MSSASGLALWNKSKNKMKNDSNLERREAEVYLVFDKDDLSLSELESMLKKSEIENFGLGFSNICFEVWLLAHFEKVSKGEISKEGLKRRLSKYINQKYTKANSKQLIKMVSNYETALRNTQSVSELDFVYQCTTVGRVVLEIMKNTRD